MSPTDLCDVPHVRRIHLAKLDSDVSLEGRFSLFLVAFIKPVACETEFLLLLSPQSVSLCA